MTLSVYGGFALAFGRVHGLLHPLLYQRPRCGGQDVSEKNIVRVCNNWQYQME